nr:hypothetical protein [Burkholderia territorii]
MLVRGDREDEKLTNNAVLNATGNEGGGTYLLPQRHWSKEDVFAYLRTKGVEIPRSYEYGLGSLDCLHCTAWLNESGKKLQYLRDFHPEAAVEYEQRPRLAGTSCEADENRSRRARAHRRRRERRLRARKNPPPFILENVLRDLKPGRVYSAEAVSLKFGVSVDAVRPIMLGAIMCGEVEERPARRGFPAGYWVPDSDSRPPGEPPKRAARGLAAACRLYRIARAVP